MDDNAKRLMRWVVLLAQTTAAEGERKYAGATEKRLLQIMDRLQAEMMAALEVKPMSPAMDDETVQNFDVYSARAAS
jgi:hypothetical protein